jgi:hypothetical protein
VTDRNIADPRALADLCTPWCVHVAATLRIGAAGRLPSGRFVVECRPAAAPGSPASAASLA